MTQGRVGEAARLFIRQGWIIYIESSGELLVGIGEGEPMEIRVKLTEEEQRRIQEVGGWMKIT